jgi:hypothetical protein
VFSGYEDHINNKFEPPEKVKRALVVVVVWRRRRRLW